MLQGHIGVLSRHLIDHFMNLPLTPLRLRWLLFCGLCIWQSHFSQIYPEAITWQAAKTRHHQALSNTFNWKRHGWTMVLRTTEEKMPAVFTSHLKEPLFVSHCGLFAHASKETNSRSAVEALVSLVNLVTSCYTKEYQSRRFHSPPLQTTEKCQCGRRFIMPLVGPNTLQTPHFNSKSEQKVSFYAQRRLQPARKVSWKKKNPEKLCSPSNLEPQQCKSVSAVQLWARHLHPTVCYSIQEQFEVIFSHFWKKAAIRSALSLLTQLHFLTFLQSALLLVRSSPDKDTHIARLPLECLEGWLEGWRGWSSPERRQAEAKGGERKCQVLLMKSRSSQTAKTNMNAKLHVAIQDWCVLGGQCIKPPSNSNTHTRAHTLGFAPESN